MKKTSIYLTPEDEARLERLVQREQKSRTEVIREALARLESQQSPRRSFRHFDSGSGDGRSVADILDDELFRGFGE